MKREVLSFLVIITLIFMFIVFYKGLNKSSFYKPKSEIKDIPEFFALSYSSKEKIDSKKIFSKDKFYLLNIWASWCVPCRNEHPILLNLGKNNKLEIIGLNYKDNLSNAKKFLDELGNPYKNILIDLDGTIAIEWGAFGVPETYLIYENKIIKKFIGPLNENSILEINQEIK